MADKPDYTPAYRVPVWLGSNDVISNLLKMEGDKATLWDVLCMIREMEASERKAG